MSKPSHGGAVFLVGFMGAGKTVVGRVLAQQLGLRFIDLDNQIERAAKRTIGQIFEDVGEAGFRELETGQLSQLLESDLKTPAVVALGGGAFTQPANVEKLRLAKAPVIFLDAPLEELLRRCEAEPQRERPLLSRGREALSILYAERRPLYLAAEATVQTSGKSVEEVASEIERWLRQHQRF